MAKGPIHLQMETFIWVSTTTVKLLATDNIVGSMGTHTQAYLKMA